MNHPTTQPDSVPTTTGETLAEVDGGHDVVVVDADEDEDTYTVQLPDGERINTSSQELDQISSVDWTDYPIDEDWTEKPWETDPNPLDPEPDDTIGTFRSPQTRTIKSKIGYICPECDGQFSTWHEKGRGVTEETTYHCPFCLTERGDYGSDDEEGVSVEEKIRKMVKQAIEEADREVSRDRQ